MILTPVTDFATAFCVELVYSTMFWDGGRGRLFWSLLEWDQHLCEGKKPGQESKAEWRCWL